MKNIKSIEEFLFESKSSAKKRFLDRGLVSEEVFDRFLEVDITPTKKFIEKMCEFFTQGETQESIISTFEETIYLTDKNILVVDISKVRSLDELKLINESDRVGGRHYPLRSEVYNDKTNVKVVYDSDRILVLAPKTKQGSCKYGSEDICISKPQSPTWGEYRHPQYDVYFYFVYDRYASKSNPNCQVYVATYPNKLQIIGGVRECYNIKNEKIDYGYVINELGLSNKLFKPVDPNNYDLEVEYSSDTNNQLELEELKRYVKGKWTINRDGSYNIAGSVDLSNLELDEIPFNFKNVTGNFIISGNNLRSLKGSPQIVGGNYVVSGNELEDLEGSPYTVMKSYDCSYNPLTSMKGVSKVIGFDLIAKDLDIDVNDELDYIGDVRIEGSVITE
jgi:hypothetical protein